MGTRGCGGSGGFAALLLQTQQGGESFVEGAFVGGSVTEEEGQTFFIDTAIGGEAVILEAEGTLAQPVGLGQVVHEQLFGSVGGLVFAAQRFAESFESGGIFAMDEQSAGGEAVL
jgi:hypothetical protein